MNILQILKNSINTIYVKYIDKSIVYKEGYTFEEFCNDSKTVDATVFIISQIGELVKNISKETMQKYSNIEWNMIKGLKIGEGSKPSISAKIIDVQKHV